MRRVLVKFSIWTNAISDSYFNDCGVDVGGGTGAGICDVGGDGGASGIDSDGALSYVDTGVGDEAGAGVGDGVDIEIDTGVGDGIG